MADQAETEKAPENLNPSDVSKANIARLRDTSDYDELVDQVSDEVSKSEKTLDPWKQRIIHYYELYKMYQSRKHYEGLADIFVPEILRAVETIVGNLYKATTQQTPWFEFQGRTKEGDGAAAAMTQLIYYQMDENGFKHRLMDSFRQMAVAGLTCRKVLWDFQQVARTRKNFSEEVKKVDPKTGKPESFRKWQKEVFVDTVKDHWTFEPVDLLSLLLPDISIPYNEMDKSRWIAEQILVDKQWVRERTKKGWLVKVDEKEFDEKSEDGTNSASRMRALKDSRIRSSGFNVKSSKPGSIEIVERWGLLPAKYVYTAEQLKDNGLEDDDQIETVLIIANRRIILKLEANPFWHNQKPYLFCPYVPQEFEFDGIGVGQIGEKLQEELNDTRNQTMDNKTLILMCMWLKSRSSGIRNADLRVRPMGVIPTNDMNGLQALRPPVLTGVGVNIEGTIKNDLRESVGASSNLQGIAQSGVGSATEASLINRDSMGRLSMTVTLYGELILKKMLIMAEYLNYQFYDHTKTIRILGPMGVKMRNLTPEELIGYKDVVLNLATDLGSDPATRRQQFMQFLTILQNMPPQAITFHWKLLDKIYKESFAGRGLDELYEAPPDDVEILDTDEEVELILSGYPLVPQNRPDAHKHAEELNQEYQKYKWSLPQQIMTVFQNVVMGYREMAMAQLQAQQAQLQMQLAAAAQGKGGQGGLDVSKMSGGSPFTQPGADSTNGAQNSGVAN